MLEILMVGQVGLIATVWFSLYARQDKKNKELMDEILSLKINDLKRIEWVLKLIGNTQRQRKTIEEISEELKNIKEKHNVLGKEVGVDIDKLYKNFDLTEKYMNDFKDKHNLLVEVFESIEHEDKIKKVINNKNKKA
jgi:hypothetical protein